MHSATVLNYARCTPSLKISTKLGGQDKTMRGDENDYGGGGGGAAVGE